MRVIAILILIFGVALAGGAVFFASERYAEIEAALARQAAEARAAAPAPEAKTAPVVVAARALRYGETLGPDSVRVVPFPLEGAPENGFATLEDLLGGEGAEPRVALRAIEPNEPILRSKVTGFGERATMSAQLEPGMRAFTLRIDAITGVAGFLLPGDRVDVVLTRNDGAGLKADIIMQGVKVIAIDQVAEETTRARLARTATVEVTPEDAQKLALAQQVGRISLSLRQIEETGLVEGPRQIDIDDIVEPRAAPEPAPAAQRGPCVRKGVELICQ